MRKKRTILWAGILLLILAAAGRAFYLYNKPHQGTEGVRADWTLEADSLYSRYSTDEKTADAKYMGKVIEVIGKVAEIQRNGQSEIWILSPQAGGGGINCQMAADEKGRGTNTAEGVKAGDIVKVKGRCTGFLMDVNLSDCIGEKK